jgi:C4-dicarboxylate transporter DctM subunit
MLIVLASSMILGIAIGVPIAVAVGLACYLAILYQGMLPVAVVAQRIFVGLDSFPLLAAPLFILAGAIMDRGGISARITHLAETLVGHIRGGLGMVVVVSAMIFSGISGSHTADTAAVGSVMIPTMIRRGYPPEFTTAVVAASGAMGILIPPSLILVFYGLLTGTSISALFMAGLAPGLLMGAVGFLTTYVMARNRNLPVGDAFNLRKATHAFGDSFWALMMPIIILAGVLLGIFTPTEAAGVAVAYGLFVSMVIYRELKPRDLFEILTNSGVTAGLVMFIVATASVFGWVLASQQVPLKAMNAFVAVSREPWFFLLVVNVVFILIHVVFEATASLIMALPVLFPVAKLYGIDPVHFGIVLTANMGIGLITPPVGLCLCVACGISGAPIDQVTRPLMPLLLTMIATLFLLTFFPEFALFLPRHLLNYQGS